jgi:hypothetical protein
MNIYDITQLILVGTAGLVFARLGLALASRLERRPPTSAGLAPADHDRLRSLEEECAGLRQELTELHERQDFTERLLMRSPAPAKEPPSERPGDRVLTPR